jgi:hypothetical protein
MAILSNLGVMLIPPLAGLEILQYIHQGTYFVAPAVKIFACLDLEQNISFLDGHQLTLQLHKKHGNMRLKPVGKGLFGVFRNAAGIHSWWNHHSYLLKKVLLLTSGLTRRVY